MDKTIHPHPCFLAKIAKRGNKYDDISDSIVILVEHLQKSKIGLKTDHKMEKSRQN